MSEKIFAKPSSVGEWKKKREPTLLPSGKYMVLKPTSLAAFLQTGTIPNSLMQMIQAAMSDKTGKKVDTQVAEMLKDPNGLKDLFEAVDAFICAVALEPRVYPTPTDESPRSDELLYADEVDLDDKMFVFTQAVGGVEEVAPFRPKPASGVGGVQPRKAVGTTAKRSAGARAKRDAGE